MKRARPTCDGCGKRAGGGLTYCHACLCVVFARRDPRTWELHHDRQTGTWTLRPRVHGSRRRALPPCDPRQLLLFPDQWHDRWSSRSYSLDDCPPEV